MAKKADKQKIVDDIAAILSIPRDRLGNGSKEHLDLLQNIATALGLSPIGGKHTVARRIIEHFGAEWTRRCYSTGESVQTYAFKIMLDALCARFGPDRSAFLVELAAVKASLRPGDLPPLGNVSPRRVPGSTPEFIRCPKVVAWILMKAEGRCEQCLNPAPFCRPDGSAYLEVHHVQPLAEGGPDTVENAVALCPTCHRAVHHAASRRDLRMQLKDRLRLRGYG